MQSFLYIEDEADTSPPTANAHTGAARQDG